MKALVGAFNQEDFVTDGLFAALIWTHDPGSDHTTQHADIKTYYSVSALLTTDLEGDCPLLEDGSPAPGAEGAALSGEYRPLDTVRIRTGSTHWAYLYLYLYLLFFPPAVAASSRWPQLGHFILIARFWSQW